MTTNPFAGVVVTASGTIPGQTHASIKHLVEQCGARFERLNVNDCTHMITTQKYVKNATKKVDAVQRGNNCKLVDFDWLVDSLIQKRPVSTESYMLKPAEDDVPGSSQVPPTPTKSPENNKRRLEADNDLVEEPPKVRRNNLDVHRRGLIALVDDRYDTQGTEVALWMDEHDVRWDAILINKLSNGQTENPPVPRSKVQVHRLQILYHFKPDKYYAWFRKMDDNTEEGELHGYGDLKTAYVEFKRLFQSLALVPWHKRNSLPQEQSAGIGNEDRCIFFQPPSEEEKKTLAPWVEKPQVPIKMPDGVPGILRLMFGNHNKQAISYLFTDLATGRIKAANTSRLDEHTLRAAILILDKLNFTLTEPIKKRKARRTANATKELYRAQQASYLKQCYFGVLGIVSNFQIPGPNVSDIDWLKQELQDLRLLLKLQIAMNKAHLYYMGNIPSDVSQQALQALGLSEIKRVRKESHEFDALSDYLKMSVGSLHTVEYKEVMNIFRIQRPGEAERYHQWREANSDKIGQRCLLWHGSGSEKFIGILSQGLRAGLFHKSTNGMFGAGIYFADMSGKAARYCGGISGQAMMLLCEVEIGKDPLNVQDCDRSALTTLKAQGRVGVVAHGRSNHNGWMNAKSVHRHLDGIRMPDVSKGREHRQANTLSYNEYVVYDEAQIQQRYLFHLRTA